MRHCWYLGNPQVRNSPITWRPGSPGAHTLKNYESEATQFIRDFLKKHPEEIEKQRQNRTTWWDRPQDFKERARLADAKVPKKGYEYY